MAKLQTAESPNTWQFPRFKLLFAVSNYFHTSFKLGGTAFFRASLKLEFETSMKIVGNCKKEFETWKLPRIRTFCCLELDVPAQPAILAPEILESGRTFLRCHCARQLNWVLSRDATAFDNFGYC